MATNLNMCLGVTDRILKLCFLNEPTILKFHVEEAYLLPKVENPDEARKRESLLYAGHALYGLAKLLAFHFKKEVRVLGFSTNDG